MAREGYYYWIDWPKYLETVDEAGMAKYINCGCLVIKTPLNKNLVNVKRSLDELGIAYEDLDAEGIQKKMSLANPGSYFPAELVEDPLFGQPAGQNVPGALYIPESGYISDPQLSTHKVSWRANASAGVNQAAIAHSGEAAVRAVYAEADRAHMRPDGSIRYENVFLWVAGERP